MTLRTALGASKILTFVILGSFVWLLVSMLDMIGSFDWLAAGTADFVGQNAVAGVVGTAVILVTLGVLLVLWSEVGEASPAPQSWPPSER